MRVRAPYALARALAATAVVLLGAASAHTWAGGTVPTGPGLALVAAVVLAGGLLLFLREVPLWALLPVVAAAQLGLHESFGLVAEHSHHAAMSPETTPAGRGRWSPPTSSSPRSPPSCGGPAGGRRRTSSRSCCARRSGRGPAASVPRRRTPRVLARAPAGPAGPRATPGGPAHLSPSGPGGTRDPGSRTATDPRRTHVHPHHRAPRRAPGRHRGPRPRARLAGRRTRDHHAVDSGRRSLHRRDVQRRARLRGIAHDQDRDPGPRVGALGDADPQPLLRRRGHHRAARRPGDRRPRQRGHRAHVLDRLHRPDPAARGAAGHLRAVVPGARRRGRGAELPDDPDLRGGRDGLDPGAGRRPGRRRAREPGTVLHDPARHR